METWNPEQLRAHLEAGEFIFLKLWKKGCGACKLSIPALERLEAADQQTLRWGQICTDDHPEMLEIAEADALPAFFIFKGGEMIKRQAGFKGLKSLQDFVAAATSGPV